MRKKGVYLEWVAEVGLSDLDGQDALKGHLKIRFRHEFLQEKSILVPQGRLRQDSESAVSTAPCTGIGCSTRGSYSAKGRVSAF